MNRIAPLVALESLEQYLLLVLIVAPPLLAIDASVTMTTYDQRAVSISAETPVKTDVKPA